MLALCNNCSVPRASRAAGSSSLPELVAFYATGPTAYDGDPAFTSANEALQESEAAFAAASAAAGAVEGMTIQSMRAWLSDQYGKGQQMPLRVVHDKLVALHLSVALIVIDWSPVCEPDSNL
jgi:hypothetical protein